MRDRPGNLLLRSLRREDLDLLAPSLTRVPLEIDQILARGGEPIQHVFFPEAGIVTLSETFSDGTRIGIGHFGYEGMSGFPILLGCDRSPHEARVTGDGGTALRIDKADLLDACRLSEDLRRLLLSYVQAFFTQLARTIVSNLTQSIDQRLCRWTLMAHDRVDGDEIKVKHDEIAVMLGVRRASVTDVLHVLEGEGFIRCRRGRVEIRDREGLRRRAGETYGFAEAEYSRLIAPFPATNA